MSARTRARETQEPVVTEQQERKTVSPAAERALAEAAARRAADDRREARPREVGGRGGKEPVRYGDWEIKGIACDF